MNLIPTARCLVDGLNGKEYRYVLVHIAVQNRQSERNGEIYDVNTRKICGHVEMIYFPVSECVDVFGTRLV